MNEIYLVNNNFKNYINETKCILNKCLIYHFNFKLYWSPKFYKHILSFLKYLNLLFGLEKLFIYRRDNFVYLKYGCPLSYINKRYFFYKPADVFSKKHCVLDLSINMTCLNNCVDHSMSLSYLLRS